MAKAAQKKPPPSQPEGPAEDTLDAAAEELVVLLQRSGEMDKEELFEESGFDMAMFRDAIRRLEQQGKLDPGVEGYALAEDPMAVAAGPEDKDEAQGEPEQNGKPPRAEAPQVPAVTSGPSYRVTLAVSTTFGAPRHTKPDEEALRVAEHLAKQLAEELSQLQGPLVRAEVSLDLLEAYDAPRVVAGQRA